MGPSQLCLFMPFSGLAARRTLAERPGEVGGEGTLMMDGKGAAGRPNERMNTFRWRKTLCIICTAIPVWGGSKDAKLYFFRYCSASLSGGANWHSKFIATFGGLCFHYCIENGSRRRCAGEGVLSDRLSSYISDWLLFGRYIFMHEDGTLSKL